MGLQNVEGAGEIAHLWFAEQHVQVFGHEDVAEDVEAVPPAELFEDGKEDGAGVVVVEVGATTTVTAEGDEVVVAGALVAFESGGHG